jgi:hypothetical protein
LLVAAVVFSAFLAKEVGIGKGYKRTIPELSNQIDQYVISTQQM